MTTKWLSSQIYLRKGTILENFVPWKLLLYSTPFSYNFTPKCSLCLIIDNICQYGYEANKRHLNQAGFVPPTKFINIFVLKRKYLLCAFNNKGCYDKSNMSTHHSKQRTNLESSTALESTGIKHLRWQNSLHGEMVQHWKAAYTPRNIDKYTHHGHKT